MSPTSGFEEARNSEKRAEINMIWNAINNWEAENNENSLDNLYEYNNKEKIPNCGNPLNASPSRAYHINDGKPHEAFTSQIDLSFLVDEGYIAELPKSPNYSPALIDNQTGYFICKSVNKLGRYVIFTQAEPSYEWIEIER